MPAVSCRDSLQCVEGSPASTNGHLSDDCADADSAEHKHVVELNHSTCEDKEGGPAGQRSQDGKTPGGGKKWRAMRGRMHARMQSSCPSRL